MARLEMVRNDRTKVYEIGEEVTLGRTSLCDIRVPSPKCSRQHCKVMKGTGGYFLEDLKSSNGTMLNGKVVGRQLLKDNDEIVLGGITFRFFDNTEKDPLIGKTLGAYAIIDKAGVGGMGVVYRAKQITLGRQIALKVLSQKLAKTPGFIDSFQREAKIAANLQHPNIIGIHDFGHEGGWHYFSMEYIDGENLLDMALRQGGLTPEECIRYGSQIADALAHAHSQGILHKDIKPQNVMIDANDHVKLADMGLASLIREESDTDEASDTKEPKKIMATPQYVAPEIVTRKEPDERSDLYSLSATLYHMLTGKPPYQADTVKDMLKKHISAPIPNPKDVNELVPDKLANLIIKGLSKKPQDRPQTAEAFAKELRSINLNKNKDDEELILEPALKIQTVRKEPRQPRVKTITNTKVNEEKDAPILPIIAAGALIVILAIFFLSLRGDPNEKALFIYNEAYQAYLQHHEDDSQALLEDILLNYPQTDAAPKAEQLLEILQKSTGWKAYFLIKQNVTDNKITKEAALDKLLHIVAVGDITEDDRIEISDYIISIGGDPNIHPEWERIANEFLLNNDLAAARSVVHKGWKNTSDPKNKAYAFEKLQEIEKKIDTKASAQMNDAAELIKHGNTVAAADIYSTIIKDSRGTKWESAAITAMVEIQDKAIQDLTQYWIKVKEKIAKGDFAGARIEAEHAASIPDDKLYARRGKVILQMTGYAEDFYNKLLENAHSNTEAAIDRVTINIDGTQRKVSLEGIDGKLYAVGKKNRKEISIGQLSADDIYRILPRYKLQPNQALGVAVYFGVRGNHEMMEKYASSAITDEAKAVFKELSAYTSYEFKLWDLDSANPEKTTSTHAKLYAGRLSFSETGTFSDSTLAFMPTGSRMKIAGKGKFIIKLKRDDNNIISLGFTPSEVILSAKIAGLAKQAEKFKIDLKAGTTLLFTDDAIIIKNGAEEIGKFTISLLNEWKVKLNIESLGEAEIDLLEVSSSIDTEAQG